MKARRVTEKYDDGFLQRLPFCSSTLDVPVTIYAVIGFYSFTMFLSPLWAMGYRSLNVPHYPQCNSYYSIKNKLFQANQSRSVLDATGLQCYTARDGTTKMMS